MRAILMILFFSCLVISSVGQERLLFDGDKQPYFLVDSFSVDLKYLVLSPTKIESISVLKDANAIAAYGDKAKYGAIIVKTKPNTTLLRVGEILDRYEIAKTDRELQVCINKTLVNQQGLVLIEEGEILGVEITTDRYWVNPKDANSNQRFINIRTSINEKKIL